MRKTLLVLSSLLLITASLAGCGKKADDDSNIIGKNDKPAIESTTESTELNEDGFISSEEVINAYWIAFGTCSKSDFELCFPNADDVKGLWQSNLEETINESYELAVSYKDTAKVSLSDITVDSESIDKDSLDNDLNKIFDIEKAEISTVNVPLVQTVDGKDYHVMDIYEFTTIRIDGNWYIVTIKEIDAKVIDENEQPTTVESIEETTEEPETTYVPDATNPQTTNTDYDKVNWGVTYAPIEDMPNLTISVAPWIDSYDNPALLVAVTNMYDTNLNFSAKASAKDSNGNYVGDTYAYLSNIGPGNTSVFKIICRDGVPNGEIHWDELKVEEGIKTYVPWEADWNISNEGNMLTLDYTVNMAQAATIGEVYGLVIDKDGNIIDIFTDYINDEKSTITTSTQLYRENIATSSAADVALFMNPTTQK